MYSLLSLCIYLNVMELNLKTLMFTALSPILIVAAILVVYLFH